MKIKKNLMSVLVPLASVLLAFVIGAIIISALGKPHAGRGLPFSGRFRNAQ